MDATGLETPNSGSTMSGGSEATSPSACDDDSRHSHLAAAASQAAKSAGALPPAPSSPTATVEGAVKDIKIVGTRFHDDCAETELQSPRLRSSRLFKGKGKETVSVERQKSEPLRFLDLPVDVLKDIVKEVTHTNDLTALARCHSALHRLAIPHIYSRFDIVWPDSNTHAEPRSGVDALTYGLATLVMAEEIFAEVSAAPTQGSNRFNLGGKGRATDLTVRRRIGNHYAVYTRKFSLGNGPPDWVQDYLITKEGGKMLGTLVALALARMRSLETFVWDMPTGILRDVWLCLASLGDRQDGKTCKLEKVWVRWHDNSQPDPASPISAPANPNMDTTPMPPPPPPLPFHHTAHHHGDPQLPPQLSSSALDRVERPSFSVLPALKSLSVLDIDELSYLDEMAVLIGKSLAKLRELRVGIARHTSSRQWVTIWEGERLRQVDPIYPTAGCVTIGEKRLGGILGVLTGFVCDMRQPKTGVRERVRRRSRAKPASSTPATRPQEISDVSVRSPVQQDVGLENLANLRDALPEVVENSMDETVSQRPTVLFENGPLVAVDSREQTAPVENAVSTPAEPPVPSDASVPSPQVGLPDVDENLSDEEFVSEAEDGVLQLDILELERVPLSIPVLQKALDWTRLTSLTLLHCANHEQLWKTLRKMFAPTPRSPTYPHARHNTATISKKGGRVSLAGSQVELDYALKLKKLHTNQVSTALISFLKDTLAPNSLEVLFLQESRSPASSATIDQIYKGPLRRHRNSLKKVLIDSSEKTMEGLPFHSSRVRRWMLTREILSFICSGKMPALRELGMAIEHRDWHFFVQHLPNISHLRSLYIPFIIEHVPEGGTSVKPLDPREMAMHILDAVALRPEIELCYVGISYKCFEILENRRDHDSRGSSGGGGDSHSGGGGGGAHAHASTAHLPHGDGGAGSDSDSDAPDDAAALDDVDVDELEEDLNGMDDSTEGDDGSDGSSSTDDDDDDDDDDDEYDDDGARPGPRVPRLRLREILFYDDKVAVFKARHGRL